MRHGLWLKAPWGIACWARRVAQPPGRPPRRARRRLPRHPRPTQRRAGRKQRLFRAALLRLVLARGRRTRSPSRRCGRSFALRMQATEAWQGDCCIFLQVLQMQVTTWYTRILMGCPLSRAKYLHFHQAYLFTVPAAWQHDIGEHVVRL